MKVKLLKKFRECCKYEFKTDDRGDYLFTDINGKIRKRREWEAITDTTREVCGHLFSKLPRVERYVTVYARQHDRKLRKQTYGHYRKLTQEEYIKRRDRCAESLGLLSECLDRIQKIEEKSN